MSNCTVLVRVGIPHAYLVRTRGCRLHPGADVDLAHRAVGQGERDGRGAGGRLHAVQVGVAREVDGVVLGLQKQIITNITDITDIATDVVRVELAVADLGGLVLFVRPDDQGPGVCRIRVPARDVGVQVERHILMACRPDGHSGRTYGARPPKASERWSACKSNWKTSPICVVHWPF